MGVMLRNISCVVYMVLLFGGLAYGEPLQLSRENLPAILDAHGPELRRARAALKSAQGSSLKSYSDVAPKLEATASIIETDESLNEPFGPGQTLSNRTVYGRAGVRQPIFAGEKLFASYDLGGLYKKQGEATFHHQKSLALLNTQLAFIDAILKREEIAIYRSSLEQLEKERSFVVERHRVGLLPEIDLMRVEATASSAKSSLLKAENDALATMMQLQNLLGVVDEIVLSGELVAPSNTTDLTRSESELIEDALSRRQDLVAAKLEVEMKERLIGVATSSFYPKIDGVAGYELRSSRFHDDFDESLKGWVVGIEGSWSLFDGGRTLGERKGAHAALRTARANHSELELMIRNEVALTQRRLKEAAAVYEAEGLSAKRFEEAYRQAGERYRVGVGTQLDLLTAETDRTRGGLAALRAKATLDGALYKFEYALGR